MISCISGLSSFGANSEWQHLTDSNVELVTGNAPQERLGCATDRVIGNEPRQLTDSVIDQRTGNEQQ